MDSNKIVVSFFAVFILGVFGFAFSIIGFDVGMTGFTVFGDDAQADFDGGSYFDTEWNGSAIVLSGDNLSGSFESRVFDSGIVAGASWNNLSYVADVVVGSDIYLTSAEHAGSNVSEVFVLDDSYYLADMKDSSKRFYLNFSEDLTDDTILRVYVMEEKGVQMGVYSQSDVSGDDPLGLLTVSSATGGWYYVDLDIDVPTDAVWIGEGNGSGIDPKDYFDYIYASVLGADVSFEVMNCSVSDCSDGSWESVDLDDMDLEGGYFKYKAIFSSDGVGVSAALREVSIDYALMNSAPVISLFFPEDVLYTNNSSLKLNYSAVDSDGNLDSCWYEVDSGGVVLLSGCVNISFAVSNGVHNLTVYANDSFGEESSDSVSFRVDTEGVDVILTEPAGVKSSRVGIPISYSSVGADECWYNVETSIGGDVIENTSLAGCGDSSFGVSSDGDYVLNLFANNSFGSFDLDSGSFSVDSSVAPPVDDGGSSGGGGSRGSSSGVSSVGGFEIEPISVIASLGEEKSLLVSVKNTGRVAANKCVLVGGDYVESEEIMNIGVGELVEFMFVLSVLDFGVEDFNLSVICLDDVVGNIPLSVVVLKPELDVSIDGISFSSGNDLLVRYSVEPADNSERVLFFSVLDSVGEAVVEVRESVDLVFGEIYEGEVLIDISDAEKGILKIAISEDDMVSLVEEDFVYGGDAGITGHALLDMENGGSFIWIVGLLFVGLIGFLGWRSWELYRKKS